MSKVDLKSGVSLSENQCWHLLVSSGLVRPRSTEWSTFALEVRKCSCLQQSNCLCCIKCGVHVLTSARATMCWVGIGWPGSFLIGPWLPDVYGSKWSMDLWVHWFSGLGGGSSVVWFVPDPGVPAHVSSYLIHLACWRLPKEKNLCLIYHIAPPG